MFIVGKQHALLNEIGIAYGYIVLEGYQQKLVYYLDHGEDILQAAVKQDVITPEEASVIKTQMTEAGLIKNCDALSQEQRNKIKQPSDRVFFIPALNGVLVMGSALLPPLDTTPTEDDDPPDPSDPFKRFGDLFHRLFGNRR